jgi:hypothetical protein
LRAIIHLNAFRSADCCKAPMALSTELNALLGPVVIGGLVRSILCDASVFTAYV